MSAIPVGLRRFVAERAQHRCEYCGLAQEGQEATFHIDHIVPRKTGGQTIEENLALACVSCSLLNADVIRHRDAARKVLHVSTCDLAHLRQGGKIAFRKAGNAYLFSARDCEQFPREIMHDSRTASVIESKRTAGLSGLYSFLLADHQGLRRTYDPGYWNHRPRWA